MNWNIPGQIKVNVIRESRVTDYSKIITSLKLKGYIDPWKRSSSRGFMFHKGDFMQGREEKEKIVNYGLIHIVDNDRDIKTIFNKKAYEAEFLTFYDIYSQSLTAYNLLYEMSSKPEEYAREVALKIMAHEMEKINEITKKPKER